MRKLAILATLAGLMLPAIATADGYTPKLDIYGFRQRHAQRAAPWFLYWPYEAYWGTGAPTGYTPQNYPMTPGFFPQQGYCPQQGGPQMYPVYQSSNGYGN